MGAVEELATGSLPGVLHGGLGHNALLQPAAAAVGRRPCEGQPATTRRFVIGTVGHPQQVFI